ncbi:Chromosome X 36 [Mactra antiquata]
MKISLGKFLHFKLPCLFIFFLFLVAYISGSLYWIFTQNFLSESAYLDREKCPLCFGESLCPKLQQNSIKPSSLSKTKVYDVLRPYATTKVHLASLEKDGVKTDLILKKLGNDHDLSDFEARICSQIGDMSCDIATAATRLMGKVEQGQSFGKFLQGSSKMMFCPSTRLLSELFGKYEEISGSGHVLTREKLQIWTTSVINQEPLTLQIFPASDGWPFPVYYGSCGMFVALSNSGKSIADFYNAEWTVRAGIAHQLMKMADMLTNNKAEFSLYLTDVDKDMFAVDSNGVVRLVDLQNVLVVDKLAVKSARPRGWNDLHESTYAECQGQSFKNCHSFSEVQLCSHVISDHNFYAICRYILSPHSDVTGQSQGHSFGLLHDIPEVAITDWDLEYLLNECVMPTRQRGRDQVVHKLIEALGNLRD